MNTEFTISNGIEGIALCSRYAFGPNRLHYCGPDANKELRELIERDGDDFELSALLKQFKTLFPYLRHIARENEMKDPFHQKVVESYWIGNELLDFEEKRDLYNFLVDDLRVKDKMKSREWRWLEEKISKGAVPHHSFHVLNVWDQRGHADKLADLERMRECIISSGTVTAVSGPEIEVETEPLVMNGNKLALGEPVKRKIVRQLQVEYDIEQIQPGQIISIHWGTPCQVITPKQAENLKKYTLKNIAFANLNS